MRKLFTEKADKIIKLAGDDHKHLSLVLRARAGDSVMVSTGDGYDYTYIVDAVSARETVLKQAGKRLNESEPAKISLTLFSAVLKGDKNDTAVRMCTELGVQKFCPIITEYSVAAQESYKAGRLRKIALEAAKQSGRGRVPEICEPVTFHEMLEKLYAYDLVLFLYERAEKPDVKTFLQEKLHNSTEHTRTVRTVAAIVGGEGGFSEQEAGKLLDGGVTPVTLGKRILRADTACAAVCALIHYEAEEME